MIKSRQLAGIFLILTLVLLAACAPQGPSQVTSPVKAAWQDEWDKVLAAAKAEGQVTAYTTGSDGERRVMMEGIKKLYGISAEVTNMMPRELTPKIQAERKAGLYLNDVYIGGYTSLLQQWKPQLLIEPFDGDLIHPDVTDLERIKKVWYKGVLPWVDQEHFIIITTLQPGFPIAINTSLVKEAEIKSYRDLLNPKWKGKIVINDATVTGGGQEIWKAVMVLMGEDFMKELVKTTDPTILRDQRLMLDWLSHGKVAVVVGPDSDTLVDFEKAGAPVKGISNPVEGGRVSASASGIARFNRPAHPNAAKVFINWLTSKEGQEAYAPAGLYQSLRQDVSTAHLTPMRMRQPGAKYYDGWTEESFIKDTPKAQKLAKELLEPLIKK